MLTYYANRGAELGYLKVSEPELDSTTLVYGSELTRAEAHSLVKSLKLEEHLVSDVFDDDELPRIEVHDELRYVFLRIPRPVGSVVRSNPVLIVIGHHLFACLSSTKIEIEEMVHPPLDKKHIAPPLLLIESLAAIAKRYESLIDSIGTTIEQTETRLHSHEATNKDFIGFVTLEGNLSRSRMNLAGIEAVTERLIDSAASKADREILDDIRLFIRQLLVEIDSHVQAIESIRNAYTTVANNTLNQRMKTLTMLTLLVALPNVFYGMFGMNVGLPFADAPWAYASIVGFTIVIIFVTYLIAKKLKLF